MNEIKEVVVKGIKFSINDKVRIKSDNSPDPDLGTIVKIEHSGYFQDDMKYDLMILWDDEEKPIRTNTKHFLEYMEIKL